jgi:hypothetical protein
MGRVVMERTDTAERLRKARKYSLGERARYSQKNRSVASSRRSGVRGEREED